MLVPSKASPSSDSIVEAVRAHGIHCQADDPLPSMASPSSDHVVEAAIAAKGSLSSDHCTVLRSTDTPNADDLHPLDEEDSSRRFAEPSVSMEPDRVE